MPCRRHPSRTKARCGQLGRRTHYTRPATIIKGGQRLSVRAARGPQDGAIALTNEAGHHTANVLSQTEQVCHRRGNVELEEGVDSEAKGQAAVRTRTDTRIRLPRSTCPTAETKHKRNTILSGAYLVGDLLLRNDDSRVLALQPNGGEAACCDGLDGILWGRGNKAVDMRRRQASPPPRLTPKATLNGEARPTAIHRTGGLARWGCPCTHRLGRGAPRARRW